MSFSHHLCPKFPAIPSNLPGASTTNDSIIIIGGGISGLSAAVSLKRMGLKNVVILEASNDVGGRLKATPFTHQAGVGPPLDLDLGAEWIHSSNGAEVLKSIMNFDNEEVVDASEDLAVVPDLISYRPTLFFRKSRARFLSWLYEETKFKSTTWYHWTVANLYEPVKDCVELNSPVSKVDYSGDGVVLILKDGSIRTADRVVCTAPLAVLKEEIIEFDPPLPMQMREAIDKIEMPPGFRVLMHMKERFYHDVSYCGSVFDLIKGDMDDLSCIYDPLWGKELGNEVNVCAYVAIGNEHAGAMSKLTNDEIAKAVMESIDEAYGGQGSKNLIGKPIVQNWTAEPFIRGAYTFPSPSKYRSELSKSLGIGTTGKKLFFAGEHTSLTHPSLVPGAACEGRRAALEVMSSLGLK